tara:strand:- start:1043 stop:1282 length:240 start_codon:yes stop_codon:yes gene_type:complete
MKTEVEARDEFNSLLRDDPDFLAQWGYCEGSQSKLCDYDDEILTFEQAEIKQENAFYEWCSNYEDLKHITISWLFIKKG